jgi:hypothetical protein
MMCPSEATCLPADRWFKELELWKIQLSVFVLFIEMELVLQLNDDEVRFALNQQA